MSFLIFLHILMGGVVDDVQTTSSFRQIGHKSRGKLSVHTLFGRDFTDDSSGNTEECIH